MRVVMRGSLSGIVLAAWSLACAGSPVRGPAPIGASGGPPRSSTAGAGTAAAEAGAQANAQPDASPATAASFSPLAGAAERYAEDPSRSGPRSDALRVGLLADLERLSRSAGVTIPRSDNRLHLVADDLARALRGEALPSPELVDFLLSHYGIPEPSPHLVLARTSAGGESALREGLAGQLKSVLKGADPMRVGIGVARDGEDVRVVVALLERRLELEPVPRTLAEHGSASLSGRLLGGLREPHIEVTGPDGSVQELPATTRSGRFHAKLTCVRGTGRYQVEIGGTDRFGASVLANFPVFCGVQAPASVAMISSPSAPVKSPRDAEQAMLKLLNRDRAAAKLTALEWDERLAGVAREHSVEMSEHDFVGHVSPRTGNALDRVQRAGISPTFLMENVGRAYSVEEVQRGLMASPAHRANILEPRARRVGIGIATGKIEGGLVPLYATQLFM